MNNPDSPRETWHEFEQEMQDFVLNVLEYAEEDYGELTRDAQYNLIEWVEDRYLDGKSSTDAEEEYLAWDEHYYSNEF